jgi:hypothetical protein
VSPALLGLLRGPFAASGERTSTPQETLNPPLATLFTHRRF